MSAPTGTRRLSRDLADLYRQDRETREGAGTAQPSAAAAKEPVLHFDLVIVGSGYGGAMAAAELSGLRDGSGLPVSVLVLERGKEYVPGMFPASGQELPTHVRVHREKSGQTRGWLDGLFDLRVGADVSALVANGLGGGSLINAGVMEIPRWDQVQRLPPTLVADLTLPYMNAVKQRLGARDGNGDNTIALHHPPPVGTRKTRALQALEPQRFRLAAITAQMGPDPMHPQCTLCGDCMTGCNVGAKKSLDTTLLQQAWQNGAQIRTGASVTDLRRHPAGWQLTVVPTTENLRRRNEPLRITAGKVILAAGTLGSPEILMRAESFALRFSPRLGQQFSCNGDNILAVRDLAMETRTAAPEHWPLDTRDVGPTITGVLDMPAAGAQPGFLLQEFAVPAALKRLFDEIVTTSSLLHSLTDPDRQRHREDDKGLDPLAVHPDAMAKVLLLGVIGHDESSGELRLPPLGRMDDGAAVEGRIRIDWPEARKSQMLDSAFARTEGMVRAAQPQAPARVLPNPVWRMLPEQLDFVLRSERGPLLTVHPLGGCPMGIDRDHGVVDEFGRVFDFAPSGAARSLHAGLYVFDGSTLPASLGANPGLTIAAIAQRAARRLAADAGWSASGAAPAPAPARPRSRSVRQCTPAKPVVTSIEMIERLSGPLRVGNDDYVAELTLQYRPHPVSSLSRRMDRRLQVQGPLAALRIYSEAVWNDRGVRFLDEAARRHLSLFEAPLSGSLRVLHRESSTFLERACRGAWAYFVNRGLRDLWSMAADWWRKRRTGEPGGSIAPRALWASLKRLAALVSHAGEVRRFDYRLAIGAPACGAQSPFAAQIAHHEIRGSKRFTYSARGNPWRQLMELRLSEFLGLPMEGTPVLTLDGRFMARFGLPLARIARQQNQVVALAELASFGLYFLRLFLSIHVWSLRAPDAMPPRVLHLLPGAVTRLPPPRIYQYELEPPRHGIPVLVRLTRYRGKIGVEGAQRKPPLVLIHGYSTSGSTFSHEAITEPMARHFWHQGRDLWLLDLRTSAGLPSSSLPWNFEDAALADIPVAIRRIRRITGCDKVDVFAHCIGAVMLSMALLTDPKDRTQREQIEDVDLMDGVAARRYPREISVLHRWINKIVLSQKGPTPVYSDANVLRAYLMRVLRHVILPHDYQFRVPPRPSLGEQALDRLLASLPYPDEELARESPLRPCAKLPWAGFRHRMDALFGHDFSLRNIPRRTLAAMEDLFGPPNLDTVAQAVHFARHNRITNGAGHNCFVTVQRMQKRWPRGGTMSIHGQENGLADVRTLKETEVLMRAAGIPFTALAVPGLGHQDCLIGSSARERFFTPIEDFLCR